MRRHIAALAFVITAATSQETLSHIGSEVYLVFEIPEGDVISLDDGSLRDWLDIVGDPSLKEDDLISDPDIGDGTPYEPGDLDYAIWLAWSADPPRIFVAMERTDDVFINDYADDLADAWRHDTVIGVQIDGDHSGGEYFFDASNCPDCTEQEIKRRDQSQAQNYQAILTSTGAAQVGYLGAGGDWVNHPPYADAGGAIDPDGKRSVLEFFVTPFDDLDASAPEASIPSQLRAGQIIGIDFVVSDFDTEPGAYHAYHTLTGQAHTWRYAQRLADARLISTGIICAVEEDAWARIKVSFDSLME